MGKVKEEERVEGDGEEVVGRGRGGRDGEEGLGRGVCGEEGGGREGELKDEERLGGVRKEGVGGWVGGSGRGDEGDGMESWDGKGEESYKCTAASIFL